jgi:hypothetical protein
MLEYHGRLPASGTRHGDGRASPRAASNERRSARPRKLDDTATVRAKEHKKAKE